jgi:hypothetical protein
MTAKERDIGGGVDGLAAAAWARLAVVGAVGWALAALFIRYANGAGLFHGRAEVVVFALCLPIAWGTARLLRSGGRIRRTQTVAAMSIALMTALFLDGIALTMAPGIYGAPPEALLPAAAWLLFGVGAFLAAAFIQQGRG